MNEGNKSQIDKASIAFHKKHKGKLTVSSIVRVKDKKTLSLVYTPGVGAVSSVVAENPQLARELTWKGRTVAVVSDGSAVLGLGNIGPYGALPVMEGKSILFKELAGVDAVPVVLDEKDPKEIIKIIRAIAPTYGAILLEDFAAPKCFEIEEQLRTLLDIPVIHDDQHGTAMVVLAGLINACKVTQRNLVEVSVCIAGAGAAGTAITKLLISAGVKDVRVVDKTGVLSKERKGLNTHKKELMAITNPKNISGELKNAIMKSDVLIGVSGPGIIIGEHIKLMNKNPIVFALANPIPEIMPGEAKKFGAYIVATGRSDFPNQINNALIFPGLFKGLLLYPNVSVSNRLMIQVSKDVASIIKKPTIDNIIPNVFDKKLVPTILNTVKKFKKS